MLILVLYCALIILYLYTFNCSKQYFFIIKFANSDNYKLKNRGLLSYKAVEYSIHGTLSG